MCFNKDGPAFSTRLRSLVLNDSEFTQQGFSSFLFHVAPNTLRKFASGSGHKYCHSPAMLAVGMKHDEIAAYRPDKIIPLSEEVARNILSSLSLHCRDLSWLETKRTRLKKDVQGEINELRLSRRALRGFSTLLEFNTDADILMTNIHATKHFPALLDTLDTVDVDLRALGDTNEVRTRLANFLKHAPEKWPGLEKIFLYDRDKSRDKWSYGAGVNDVEIIKADESSASVHD